MIFGPLIFLLACDDASIEVAAPPPTPEVSRQTTFATVAALGSHRLEARTTTTITRDNGAPVVEEEAFSLRWTDEDHWQAIRRRGDRVLQEVRVWDGVAWLSTRGRPLEKRGDAEPFRADLGVSWDPWRQSLGAWAEYVGFRPLGEERVEGRTAHVYAVEALPEAPGAAKSRGITSVEGKVWIDEATAARLVGDLRVGVHHRDEERTIELRFSLTDIGGDAGVEPPPDAPEAGGAAVPALPARESANSPDVENP